MPRRSLEWVIPVSTVRQDATFSLVGGGVTNYLGNVHVVCVYNPYAGYVSLYTNGVLAAINNSVTHALAATLGSDPLNALGVSLYAADPFLTGSIDELRIYNGPLSAAQIAADHALGPNQLIGTTMNVSLSASLSGGNVVLKWPTTSALVDVISSPVLGPGASWTAVNGPLTAGGRKLPDDRSGLGFRTVLPAATVLMGITARGGGAGRCLRPG